MSILDHNGVGNANTQCSKTEIHFVSLPLLELSTMIVKSHPRCALHPPHDIVNARIAHNHLCYLKRKYTNVTI